MEQPHVVSQLDQQQILQDLLVSDAFEHYLATKFPKNKVRKDSRCIRENAFIANCMWHRGYCDLCRVRGEGKELRMDLGWQLL